MLGFCISCGEYKMINRNRLCLVCQTVFESRRKNTANKPIRIGDDIQKAIADFIEWKAEVEKGLRFTIVTINDKTRLV